MTGHNLKFTASKKQLQAISSRLERADYSGDFSVYIKCQALLLILEHQQSFEQVGGFLNRSSECIRLWFIAFATIGSESLKIKPPRGRQPKLTKDQLHSLREIISASPIEAGFSSGCWNSAMVLALIKKLFKISFSVKYLPELLHRIGLSYQKAKFLASKADATKRADWKTKIWPKILAKGKKDDAMILFVDEASFALWGSLGYTWALRGQQPEILTNGARKNLKVFGAIDFFTGRLFSHIIEGKLNTQSYLDFLRKIIRSANQKILIIHDGARYHTSGEVKDFVKQYKGAVSMYRLPSYSPDLNPIENLWRKIKRAGTHNVYFSEFADLMAAVRAQLAKIKQKPSEILNFMGAYVTMKTRPAVV